MAVLERAARREATWDYEKEGGGKATINLLSLKMSHVRQVQCKIANSDEDEATRGIDTLVFVMYLAAKDCHEGVTEEEISDILDPADTDLFEKLMQDVLMPNQAPVMAECPECKHRFPFEKTEPRSPEPSEPASGSGT